MRVYNIDCPHLSNCINANTYWCTSCRLNENHKSNYYTPAPYTPRPYTNPYPIWHYYWCQTGNNTQTQTGYISNPTIATTNIGNYYQVA